MKYRSNVIDLNKPKSYWIPGEGTPEAIWQDSRWKNYFYAYYSYDGDKYPFIFSKQWWPETENGVKLAIKFVITLYAVEADETYQSYLDKYDGDTITTIASIPASFMIDLGMCIVLTSQPLVTLVAHG